MAKFRNWKISILYIIDMVWLFNVLYLEKGPSASKIKLATKLTRMQAKTEPYESVF